MPLLTPAPWEQLAELWWVKRLRGCAQNPEHHAEGDVFTHLEMVLDKLTGDPDYQALSPDDQAVLWNAALFHDSAKPDCTRGGPDGVSARGHSRRGARLAREVLWRMGADPDAREMVTALVQEHMTPFWLWEQPDPRYKLLTLAMNTRCDLLTLHARADARGRISDETERLLRATELFAAEAEDADVEQKPPEFPSDHSRVLYYRQGGDPGRDLPFQPRCRVTMLSGLPGSGKDHWASEHLSHLPQVSLDEWRRKLRVDPRDPQGAVAEAARRQARDLLRAGQDFIWNATNLSRSLRSRCLELCLDYGAHTTLLTFESSEEELARRNAERSQPVPPIVIDRLLRRWDYPHPGEAHVVRRIKT